MPNASGGVASSSPRRTTRVDVGPSSSSPSLDTNTTSSAPRRCASRTAARLTAYDSVFAPASNHGLVALTSLRSPRSSSTTSMPSVRSRRRSGDTVPYAQPVGCGCPSTPRVSTIFTQASSWSASRRASVSTASRHRARFGAGRSSMRADRAKRSRCASNACGYPRPMLSVSKMPSPRVAATSSTESCGCPTSASINAAVAPPAPLAKPAPLAEPAPPTSNKYCGALMA